MNNTTMATARRGVRALFVAGSLSLMTVATTNAQEVAWDLPVQWPDGNFMTEIVKMYADAVAEASGGDIQLTVHSGGSLGVAGADMLGAIRDGVFKIGEYSLPQAVGEEPIFGMARLPGLFESYAAYAAFYSVAKPVYQEKLGSHNQVLLFNVPWPQSHIHIKGDISSMSDLEGKKIRTYDPFGTKFYQKLGASPIQMPWAEVIPALASGVLDGVHTSASSGVDGKFWEFLNTTELLSAQTSTSGVFVNKDALEALSPEHRRVIVEVARQMEIDFWLRSQADEASKIDLLSAGGMTVEEAPADIRAAALRAAQEIAAEFAADVPEAKAVIDRYYTLRGLASD